MIKKILLDVSASQNDYVDFINRPEIKNQLNKLHDRDEEYVVGLDIADKNSKDYSCMAYYKIDRGGKITFDRVMPIKNK